MVIKKLASIGNSYGVILDRYILRKVGIDSETLIEVKVNGSSIVVSAAPKTANLTRSTKHRRDMS
jgi:antitoxin component of MazEF toxin-antitoxin module